MVMCSAPGCREYFVKGGAITFHSFPKDPIRRRQWEEKVKRKYFVASSTSKLCSKHFTANCFDRKKFGGTWLKTSAVPTIFPSSSQTPEVEQESPQYILPDKQPIVMKLISIDSSISKVNNQSQDGHEHMNKNKRLENVNASKRHNSNTNKGLEHLGFTEEDMKNHAKACQFLSLAKEESAKEIYEIKKLNRQLNCLHKRFVKLLDAVDDMQK